MARKKMLVIPVFIPFGGCPHRCVFCDQKGITGASSLPTEKEAVDTIEAYLSTWRSAGRIEVAFYGGSFTGLPFEVQKKYLGLVAPYVSAGKVDGIRVSTRPDYISKDTAFFLKENSVTTVELGVQSMSDEVLHLSGRGHGAGAALEAMTELRAIGLAVGVQFMPGLPGDTARSIVETAEKVIALMPDFVRVYPTLVIKDTPLHRMYMSGEYAAWGLDEMVEVCKEVCAMFGAAGIPVIRVGLQTTDSLLESLVAGPYHPSFRQLLV